MLPPSFNPYPRHSGFSPFSTVSVDRYARRLSSHGSDAGADAASPSARRAIEARETLLPPPAARCATTRFVVVTRAPATARA